MAERLEERNRTAYGSEATVRHYSQSSGWADTAERVLLNRVADEVRCQPVLDIGVGGGRTAWMLRLLSADYVAVDFSSEMVDACRRQYPGLDVRQADVRSLSQFGDGRFKLVVFSFNGIDHLDRPGRLRAMAELERVLQPGGLLLYSTTNKHGPNHNRKPWTPMAGQARGRPTRLLRFLRDASLARYARTYANWWRGRRFALDAGSWALGPVHPHELGMVVHFTLPSTETQALSSVGLATEAVLDRDGGTVVDDSTSTPWFYVLARKPSA